MTEIVNNETILIEIQTNDNPMITERRFATNIKVCDLKSKLELITGASNESMVLEIVSDSRPNIRLDDNERQLKSYLDANDEKRNKLRIHVKGCQVIDDDLSRVPKYEISQEEYQKRDDSVLAFKMRHNLGRFANTDPKSSDSNANSVSSDIRVGQRCEVCIKGSAKRRATVMFVGNTAFKSGVWVGVKYDEPLGKNNGSVDGVTYFECRPKYGGFVRPNDLVIGDFPEISMDFEEEV